MSRTLEFRAWIMDKMLYSDVNVFGEIRFFDKIGDLSYNWDTASDKIEQFTGLLDKNGVKIFEGDVVKRVLTGIDSLDKCHLVSFNKGSFVIGEKVTIMGVRSYLRISNFTSEIEVIGNIHQNPNLLTK